MEFIKDKGRFKFIILVISVVLLWYLGRAMRIDTQGIQEYLGRLPVFFGATVFIVLYVVLTFFIWFSKDIFKIASAIAFGPLLSTVFIWIAETINAFILFGLARYLGRDFVEKKLGGGGGLDRKLADFSLSWLFLIRAAPLLPFRFMDLAAGLSGIPFRRYLAAVIFASPVRIFWVQFILAGVGEAIFRRPDLLVDYLSKNRPVYIFSFIYLILAFIVARKIKIKG